MTISLAFSVYPSTSTFSDVASHVLASFRTFFDRIGLKDYAFTEKERNTDFEKLLDTLSITSSVAENTLRSDLSFKNFLIEKVNNAKIGDSPLDPLQTNSVLLVAYIENFVNLYRYAESVKDKVIELDVSLTTKDRAIEELIRLQNFLKDYVKFFSEIKELIEVHDGLISPIVKKSGIPELDELVG